MNLARRKRRAYEDSAALSDLAFLLIIYFIVIAGFNVNKGFLMNLPAKDSTRFVLKDDLLRFELDASGSLSHQGEAVDIALAEAEIRGLAASHPNLALALSVDPETPWQNVVSFVELAQKLHVESFSFSMASASGGGGGGL
ncbi:MAG: biopolymer transporter ExbD [Spirochaetales bacterium]|jgi:biopolymer transport protein ExbD|nr:biopolymer transporter ExbD [Spirochaetales bacterium]